MVVSAILSIAFGAASIWAFLAQQTDLVLITLPAALAGLILAYRAWRRPAAPPRRIVVDGSNVLHWQDNQPRLSTLQAVLDDLTARGYTPGVVFDANAGYKISDRYQHDGALARLLGLPRDRVLVAPKGSPADPLILAAARDLGVPIVTNDRYRDWLDHHPEVETPGKLVRGGFRDGKPWLDLD